VHYFFSGAALGFLVAAPVGPIGLLCIFRTLHGGWLIGFSSGLGAAVADTVYAAIAAFGIGAVISATAVIGTPLHVGGSLLLCAMGLHALRPAGTRCAAPDTGGNAFAAFGSTVLLTIVNPATIIAFLAVFAGPLGGHAPSAASAAILVGGVFAGSAAWWLVLCGGVALSRRYIPTSLIRWIRVASGIGLIGFGCYGIWLFHPLSL